MDLETITPVAGRVFEGIGPSSWYFAHSKVRTKVYPLTIAAALVLGFLVRAIHVLSSDFPLNDGGMFYSMVSDLQNARYRLPFETSYNSLNIPFSYPPFGFYVVAVFNRITGLSFLEIFRLVPLVTTSLTLVAFFLLSRSLLSSKAAVVASVFAFALIPQSFIWLLMGGGVTRSWGFLFAILALHQVHTLYTRRTRLPALLSILFCGLTVLSHLETAWFLTFSIALFFLAYGRHRFGMLSSVIVAVGTIAFTAPWWATVLSFHGVQPFLAAAQTGGSIFRSRM